LYQLSAAFALDVTADAMAKAAGCPSPSGAADGVGACEGTLERISEIAVRRTSVIAICSSRAAVGEVKLKT